MHKVLEESVAFLLRKLQSSEADQLPVMLRLVRERKELIEKELRYERMMAPEVLPPTLKNLYSLDFLFEETEVIRVYAGLLESLSDAEQSIRAKIGDQKDGPPASDL